MTPSTLSDLCCITTKTHLKHLVKAIDRIRDHLVFTTFGTHQHLRISKLNMVEDLIFRDQVRYDMKVDLKVVENYEQPQPQAATTTEKSKKRS